MDPWQVPGDGEEAGRAEPKYDITSKGHKILDLGIGSSKSRPPSSSATWQQLRKAGLDAFPNP